MQSQSRPDFLVCRKKRFKYSVSQCGFYSLPIIGIFQYEILLLSFGSQRDTSLLLSVKSMHQAVHDQVGQDLGIGPGITVQFKLFVYVQIDLNISAFQPWIKTPDNIFRIFLDFEITLLLSGLVY